MKRILCGCTVRSVMHAWKVSYRSIVMLIALVTSTAVSCVRSVDRWVSGRSGLEAANTIDRRKGWSWGATAIIDEDGTVIGRRRSSATRGKTTANYRNGTDYERGQRRLGSMLNDSCFSGQILSGRIASRIASLGGSVHGVMPNSPVHGMW